MLCELGEIFLLAESPHILRRGTFSPVVCGSLRFGGSPLFSFKFMYLLLRYSIDHCSRLKSLIIGDEYCRTCLIVLNCERWFAHRMHLIHNTNELFVFLILFWLRSFLMERKREGEREREREIERKI